MDIGTSKLGQGNCGHSIVGEVEKYNGPAVTVDVFTAPKRRRLTTKTKGARRDAPRSCSGGGCAVPNVFRSEPWPCE